MFSGADDDLSLISQYYQTESSYSYTQFVPQQLEIANSKPRRRRKKNKSDESGNDGAMRKRKLTQEQVDMLEQYFGSERKLESERKDKLASELGLDPRQVAVWFQNRRARWKTQKLEEEYSKLKTEHDNTVVEKCHLESELLKLKERLVEVEQEVQRLSARCDVFSSNSPNSSFVSMEVMEPPYLRESDMNGFGNVLYEAQNSYINGVEWDSLYYTTTM